MDSKKLLNTAKLLLKIGVTVLLVYLVFRKIDFSQVVQTIGRSEPLFLVLALLLYFGSQVISSWRLQGLLVQAGFPIGFLFNLRLYMLGMFYNVFLPGGVGGDGYKVYLLRKKFGKSTKHILLTLLLDRASGLWAITILLALVAMFLPVLDLPLYLPFLYLILAGLGFFIAWRLLFPLTIRYFPKSCARAVLVQSIQCVAMICILRALHLDGNYIPYIFSFLLSTIATAIPVSVGGLGLREYVMVQVAPLLMMNEALAVTASFCFYILSTLSALPGLWYVYHSAEFSRPDPISTAGTL